MTTIESTSVAQLDAKSKFLIFLRLSRPQYIVSHLYAFVPPYLATGEFYWPVFLAGVVSCFINVPFSTLLNNYTDQTEDRINFPARVKMCEMVGYKSIRNLGIFFFILSVLLTLVFVYVSTITVAVIYLLGISLMMNYSWGLRFKWHPALTFLMYATAFPLRFAGAWAMHKPLHTLPPMVLILSYVMAVVGSTLKNLPDALGDRQAGVRTLFTDSPKIATMGFVIWFSTYVLVALLVVLKVLELKYLTIFVTFPMAAYGFWWMARAESTADRERVFSYSRLYRYAINGIVFLTLSPTIPVLIALLVLVAGNYAVSYAMDPEHFSFGGIYSR